VQFSRRPLDVVGVGVCRDDGGNGLVFSEQCGSQTATIKEEKWLIDREDDEMERRATEWGRVRRNPFRPLTGPVIVCSVTAALDRTLNCVFDPSFFVSLRITCVDFSRFYLRVGRTFGCFLDLCCVWPNIGGTSRLVRLVRPKFLPLFH